MIDLEKLEYKMLLDNIQCASKKIELYKIAKATNSEYLGKAKFDMSCEITDLILFIENNIL